MTPARAPRAAERGFILIAVLWLVAALAMLASIYSVYATNTAMASHVADDRLQAEAAVRSAVELAAFQILAAAEKDRPRHGAFETRVGHTAVAVSYVSEGARIDLNAAPKELLRGLFLAVGARDKDAAAYADRIVGWRKKHDANASDNAETDAYKTAGRLYPPRQAPFNSALELSLLLGMPEAMVERVLPDVTVFSGKPQVDVLEATPEVLAALPGMQPERLQKVLAARAKAPGDGKALLAMLGAAASSATIEPQAAFRATVVVEVGHGRRVRAEVVFRISDSGDDPFGVVLWRDDFDGPFVAG